MLFFYCYIKFHRQKGSSCALLCVLIFVITFSYKEIRRIKQEILSKDVVKGDILLLEAGDMIVADGRIIENFSLQVNESSLTGESNNIDKKDADITAELPLGDLIQEVLLLTAEQMY